MQDKILKMIDRDIKARKLINKNVAELKEMAGIVSMNPELEALANDFGKFRVESFNELTREGYEGVVSLETIDQADLLVRRLENVAELELNDEAEIELANNFASKSKRVLRCVKECDKLSREHQEMLIRMFKLSEKIDLKAPRLDNVNNVKAIVDVMDLFVNLG